MLACSGKRWWTYKNAAFLSSRHIIRHPKSSYATTKLYGISKCGCNNNTISSEITIFTLPIGVLCRAAPQRHWPGSGKALRHWPGSGEALMIHAEVERWHHCWIHYFSCSKFPFCLNIMIIVNCCSLINCNWCVVSLDIAQVRVSFNNTAIFTFMTVTLLIWIPVHMSVPAASTIIISFGIFNLAQNILTFGCQSCDTDCQVCYLI